MKRYTIFLPIPMIKAFLALSKKSGYSAAELIRKALQAFLDTQEPRK